MKYKEREIGTSILASLDRFPAVALLGPRQCGKSTLAKHTISKIGNAVYLDLEKASDRHRLSDPELFFQLNGDKLICLDEIQKMPEIFSSLRSVIDEQQRNGQFLILGSASRDLIRQSSETLAGRIVYEYLTPFTCTEVIKKDRGGLTSLQKYFVRGGFPRSYLAADLKGSIDWRRSFTETFLQRDIPQMGFDIPPDVVWRLWRMCAYSQSQPLNSSSFADSLGYNHQTVRRYLDILQGTFVLRLLPPVETNSKKRLVKSPKIYIRDTGILMSLLNLETMNDLMAHPVFDAAWESMVIENVLNKYRSWNFGFYRTSQGSGIDLILQKGPNKLAVECNASSAPKLSRGFYYAMDDLEIEEAYVIAPISAPSYPLRENVTVISLLEFLRLDLGIA